MPAARLAVVLLLVAGCGPGADDRPAIVLEQDDDAGQTIEALLREDGRQIVSVLAYRWRGGTLSGFVTIFGDGGEPVERPLVTESSGIDWPGETTGSGFVAVVIDAPTDDGDAMNMEVFGRQTETTRDGARSSSRRIEPTRGIIAGTGGLSYTMQEEVDFSEIRVGASKSNGLEDVQWLTVRVDRTPAGE